MEMFRRFLRERVFSPILLGRDRAIRVTEELVVQGFSSQVSRTAPNKLGELKAMLEELGLADDPDMKFLLTNNVPLRQSIPLFSSNKAAFKALVDQSDKFGIDVGYDHTSRCFSFTLNRTRLEEVAGKVVDRAMRQLVYLKSRGLDAQYILMTRVLVQPFMHHLERNSLFSFKAVTAPPSYSSIFSDASTYAPVGVNVVTISVGALGGLDIIPVERELDFILVTPDVSKA